MAVIREQAPPPPPPSLVRDVNRDSRGKGRTEGGAASKGDSDIAKSCAQCFMGKVVAQKPLERAHKLLLLLSLLLLLLSVLLA